MVRPGGQQGAMKTALGLVAALALVAAGCGQTKTVTVVRTVKPCGGYKLFGHIASMKLKGTGEYELRFDPAWFLTGVTANTAAAEDGAVEAGQPGPNDNYIVDESHRLYTFFVRENAHVTVLTPKSNVKGEPIRVDELAQLVAGKHPLKLFEGLDTGFWMTVHVDTACALAQQYHP
jgi:hypothetical protein